MALPDLTQLTFGGYISGQDLMQYLPIQYLQNIYQINSGNVDNTANIFQRSVKIAMAKVKGALNTIYDIQIEYEQVPDSFLIPETDFRSGLIVELVAFFACYEIARNSDAIKNPLKEQYKEMESLLFKYKSKSDNIPDLIAAPISIRSDAYLFNNNHRYLK